MRAPSMLLISLAFAGPAVAQPDDPYRDPPPPATPAKKDPPARPAVPPAPSPAPASPAAPSPAAAAPVMPPDPVLAEQVALQLVHRAQELYDARVFVDAKQLAVEALGKSPRGAAAEQARFLIKAINQELGIVDEPPRPEEKVDLTPIKDPADQKVVDTSPEMPVRARRLTSGVHSALYVGLLGATVGAFIKKDSPAGGAVPVGVATGLAAGLYLPRLLNKLSWNEGQIRFAGAGTVWGGVIGGLFADSVKTQGTKATHVLVGASIGATVLGVGSSALARENRYTPGDVALIDTLGGIGALGGLTIGMLMQPVETEAYSVNSIVGTVSGVLVGMIAAPQTNTTPRRMLRVAGMSLAGGSLPFLLYAGIRDRDSVGDERITGLLSSLGLVGGLWLGFRLTSGLDEGADVLPGKRAPKDDAPISFLGRHSDGRWTVGSPAVQPLSPLLSPQPGMSLSLLGATF